MNFDEKMQNYLDILKSATETDEAACAELRAGRRQGAKEKFSRASALYARAASFSSRAAAPAPSSLSR